MGKRLSRILSIFLGPACEKCGRRGAAIVLDAVRTSRKELDGGRYRVSTFDVRSCTALCPRCRGK